MPPKHQTQRINDLLVSVTEEMLGGDGQPFQDNGLRVERLLLELVRPDPVQPRRVLPEAIHFAFHNHQLTPIQALRQLVQLVKAAARQQGRPFNGVLELLPDGDDESDAEIDSKLSPEEQLLRELVNLAVTIRDDGQVNPLTVVDVSQGVTQLYRIETGERRYWATWLLRDFIPSYEGNGMVPCMVIPAERASIFRQAKENTSRIGLSAIAMARQAALLLLTIHGYEIPMVPVSNDFYRQALALDLRGKREYTEAILAAMGGIKKGYFSYLKNLLRLSDESMELADRHAIDERRLRPVIALAPEYHTEVVRQIIDLNLTARQVNELCEGDLLATVDDELDKIPAFALKLAKATQKASAASPQELARALLRQEGNLELARARLQVLGKLVRDAERYLMDE